MIVTILLCAVILLLALLATQFWVLITITKRNQHLEFEVEDRDRQAFSDLQAMFHYQEQLDNKNIYIGALLGDIEDRERVIEMLLEEDAKRSKDFETSLELVLNGR